MSKEPGAIHIPLFDHAATNPFYHILLLLLSLWGCGQGASLVHHIHRLTGPVGLGRRLTVEGRMGPLGV